MAKSFPRHNLQGYSIPAGMSEYGIVFRVMNPFSYFADKGTAQPIRAREKFRIWCS